MSPRIYQSKTRKAAADRTRDRIIAAAREVVLSAADATRFSIDAVANEADVSRMTVYHQFGSRQALIDAVLDDFAERGQIQANLERAFTDEDPLQTLALFVRAFVRFWATDPQLVKRLRALAMSDETIAHRDRQERGRVAARAVVQRLIGAGKLARATRDASDAADLLWVLTSFETYEALATGNRTTPAIERLVHRAVTRALGVAPPSA